MTEIAAAVETPAPQDEERAAMDAVWEKYQAKPEPETKPEPEKPEGNAETAEAEAPADAPAEAAEAPQEAQPKAEPPDQMPASIKSQWGDMPEPARDAVKAEFLELNRRMAEQGRVVSAARPVYDVLVRAAQEMPALSGMTPAQIAQDVFVMAGIQDNLRRDPVNTLLQVAQRYNALDGLRAAIGGEPQPQDGLLQELANLRQQLSEVANPGAIDARVMQAMTAREMERLVTDFAKDREHWADAETGTLAMIPLAQQKLGEQAAPKAVLEAAYDMALYADPDLRKRVLAAAAPTPAPAPKPDPALVARQAQAKAVNVGPARPTSPPAPKTEAEVMEEIWRRHRG